MRDYIIRGFTSKNPDFEIVGKFSSADGDAMRESRILEEIWSGLPASKKKWRDALTKAFVGDLSMDNEREDLRDDDTQRVWVLEIMPDGGGDDTESEPFMITINPL